MGTTPGMNAFFAGSGSGPGEVDEAAEPDLNNPETALNNAVIAQNSVDLAENSPKVIKVKKRASGLPRMGKPKLPEEKCRVFVSVRVLPITKRKLESMGAKNLGWALDSLVAMADEAGLLKIPTTFI